MGDRNQGHAPTSTSGISLNRPTFIFTCSRIPNLCSAATSQQMPRWRLQCSSPQDWTAPARGIQLFGSCTEIGGDAICDAERVYEHRYTAYGQWKAALNPGDPAGQYRFYRFVPDSSRSSTRLSLALRCLFRRRSSGVDRSTIFTKGLDNDQLGLNSACDLSGRLPHEYVDLAGHSEFRHINPRFHRETSVWDNLPFVPDL